MIVSRSERLRDFVLTPAPHFAIIFSGVAYGRFTI